MYKTDTDFEIIGELKLIFEDGKMYTTDTFKFENCLDEDVLIYSIIINKNTNEVFKSNNFTHGLIINNQDTFNILSESLNPALKDGLLCWRLG